MFKVAVVGCGGIGNAHCAAWGRLEDVKLVAVCDLNKERADALGEKYNCAVCYDIADLPSDLDAVSVVTPPNTHYAVVKPLLERGYNVFCEKPITTNVSEGEDLLKTAAACGVKMAVGFKMRYEPIFLAAKKFLPEIGTLRSIVTTKQQKFNPRPESAWVTRTGAMYELSIHDFDLITHITGKAPQKVLYAKLAHNRNWEKEDNFSAIVDYGDGVTANLQGMYCDDTIFCFRDLTITFLGEKGYMRVERPDRILIHTDALRVEDIGKAERNVFDVELEEFKKVVEGKAGNPPSAEDAVIATKLVEDIRAFDTYGK